MSDKANPKLIGAFVLGAVALTIAAVAVFGGGQFFKETRAFVMYFSEPVSGLDVGAPIVLKGVKVGTVTDIDLDFDVKEKKILIPVYGQFVAGTVNLLDVSGKKERALIEKKRRTGEIGIEMIKRGLRAQLGMGSIITGKALVNLVIQPKSPVKLVVAGPDFRTPDGMIEVPTVPSQLQEVKATFTRLIRKLNALPLDKMVNDLNSAIVGFKKLVTNPKIAEILEETDAVLTDARQLVNGIDAEVKPLSNSATGALDAFKGAADEGEVFLARARTTLNKADAALDMARTLLSTANTEIKPGSPLYYELVKALRDVGGAARSIQSLSDSLERNPDSILFGRSNR